MRQFFKLVAWIIIISIVFTICALLFINEFSPSSTVETILRWYSNIVTVEKDTENTTDRPVVFQKNDNDSKENHDKVSGRGPYWFTNKWPAYTIVLATYSTIGSAKSSQRYFASKRVNTKIIFDNNLYYIISGVFHTKSSASRKLPILLKYADNAYVR